MKELENNDFVIGSRYIEGGGSTMRGTRLFLSYTGNKFIKFILNINSNEYTSSYRGFNLNRFKFKYSKKISTFKGGLCTSKCKIRGNFRLKNLSLPLKVFILF